MPLGVPEEKVPAFFFMIPLERWNTGTRRVRCSDKSAQHDILFASWNTEDTICSTDSGTPSGSEEHAPLGGCSGAPAGTRKDASKRGRLHLQRQCLQPFDVMLLGTRNIYKGGHVPTGMK